MGGGVADAATAKPVTIAAGTVLDCTTNQLATFYKSVKVQPTTAGDASFA